MKQIESQQKWDLNNNSQKYKIAGARTSFTGNFQRNAKHKITKKKPR